MPDDYQNRPQTPGPLGETEPELPDESTRPVAVPGPDEIADVPAQPTPEQGAVPAAETPADANVDANVDALPAEDDDLLRKNADLDDAVDDVDVDNDGVDGVTVDDAALDEAYQEEAYLDAMTADDEDAAAPEPEIADEIVREDDDDAEESTRPKAPPGLHEAILAQQAAEREAAEQQTAVEEPPQPPQPASTFAFPDLPGNAASAPAMPEPPVDPAHDTAPVATVPPRAVPRVLLAVVMLGMVCLCLTLVGLAGFAGYRDGLATNDVKLTQTMATEIAAQYQAAVEDIEAERYGLAMERLAWIIETVQPGPEYMRDSRAQWARAATMNAITPTALATATLAVTPTPEPLPLATEELVTTEMAPTADPNDPATLYAEAEQAARLGDFETAIQWLDSVRAIAPDYRPADVNAMLMDALTKQGTIYLRGANADGEDKLLRGILLIYRADDLGTVQPDTLLYEADFAERYLNARNYLDGGNTTAAVPILERLCAENCDWAYRGVSVRDLVEEATGVRPE